MDKLENSRSRVQCIRSMCRSFWPLILKQTVILTAMSNYFLSYTQIIGQWPMTNGNPATPCQPSCTVSRQHNWMDCGRLGLMLCSRSLLRTVLELIGRNPGMLFAVRLDVWNRFPRCTSLMWLSKRRDITRGRPERLRSLVLPKSSP